MPDFCSTLYFVTKNKQKNALLLRYFISFKNYNSIFEKGHIRLFRHLRISQINLLWKWENNFSGISTVYAYAGVCWCMCALRQKIFLYKFLERKIIEVKQAQITNSRLLLTISIPHLRPWHKVLCKTTKKGIKTLLGQPKGVWDSSKVLFLFCGIFSPPSL